MQMNCTNEPAAGALPTLEEVMQKKLSELTVLEKMVLAGMTPTAEQLLLPEDELLQDVLAELAAERGETAEKESVPAKSAASEADLLQKKFSELTPEEKAVLVN
jgi:cell division protein FtsL